MRRVVAVARGRWWRALGPAPVGASSCAQRLVSCPRRPRPSSQSMVDLVRRFVMIRRAVRHAFVMIATRSTRRSARGTRRAASYIRSCRTTTLRSASSPSTPRAARSSSSTPSPRARWTASPSARYTSSDRRAKALSKRHAARARPPGVSWASFRAQAPAPRASHLPDSLPLAHARRGLSAFRAGVATARTPPRPLASSRLVSTHLTGPTDARTRAPSTAAHAAPREGLVLTTADDGSRELVYVISSLEDDDPTALHAMNLDTFEVRAGERSGRRPPPRSSPVADSRWSPADD